MKNKTIAAHSLRRHILRQLLLSGDAGGDGSGGRLPGSPSRRYARAGFPAFSLVVLFLSVLILASCATPADTRMELAVGPDPQSPAVPSAGARDTAASPSPNKELADRIARGDARGTLEILSRLREGTDPLPAIPIEIRTRSPWTRGPDGTYISKEPASLSVSALHGLPRDIQVFFLVEEESHRRRLPEDAAVSFIPITPKRAQDILVTPVLRQGELEVPLYEHVIRFRYEPHVYELEVRSGEKAERFFGRLIETGLATEKDLAALNPRSIGAFSYLPRNLPAGIGAWEGLLPPGEYRFHWGESVLPVRAREATADQGVKNIRTIVSTMVGSDPERYAYSPRRNGLSWYEQLVVASIVEKEAAGGENYDLVAAVTLRRLRSGALLQMCSTVEYVLGYHRPFLLLEDLKVDSPYNTYKYRGIPPTPIAFFSREALEAVRNPISTEWYFFVYDWTIGKHSFAVTYEEHERNADRAKENYARLYGEKSKHALYPGAFFEPVKPPAAAPGSR